MEFLGSYQRLGFTLVCTADHHHQVHCSEFTHYSLNFSADNLQNSNSIESVGWSASLQLKKYIVCFCTAFHKFLYLEKWFKIILFLNYQSFLALLSFIFYYIPISCLPYLLKKIFHLYLQGKTWGRGSDISPFRNTNTASFQSLSTAFHIFPYLLFTQIFCQYLSSE